MTRATLRNLMRLAGPLLLASTLMAARADVKGQPHPKTERVLHEEPLRNGKTIDLFLRKSNAGHLYLYLGSANGKLTIYDVSRPAEPKEMNRLTMSDRQSGFQVRPVTPDVVIASEAPAAVPSLEVLDLSNTPSAKIARRLKNVDAYAIDDRTNTLYVARRGQLVIMQFGQPITRQTEIWEQSYEAR